MHDLIPLSTLPAGQNACVKQVVGLPAHVHRMEELGVRDGVNVEMLQTGSPCIVQLEGNKLCFRGGELLGVLVRPGASA